MSTTGHGAKMFFPVNKVAAISACYLGTSKSCAAPGLGFAPPTAKELAILHYFGKIQRFLLIVSQRVDEAHNGGVHMHGHRCAGASGGQFFDHHAVAQHVQFQSAVLLGDSPGQQTVLPDVVPTFLWVHAGLVIVICSWRQRFPRQPLRCFYDDALLIGDFKVHLASQLVGRTSFQPFGVL